MEMNGNGNHFIGRYFNNQFIFILSYFFKEHWENILAMRIRNKHLEPRGCDTIGDTITDEKVSLFLFFS